MVTTTPATRPTDTPTTTSRRTGAFLREFLRDPLTTASVVPSSPALAAAMMPADRRRPVVVELGPGTGAFSRVIQARSPNRHLGIELNPTMSALLAADYPDMEVITARAADLTEVLDSERLLGQVDLIVSGLPWAAFTGPGGAGLIPAIAMALRQDGMFTQFTYSWTRWTPPGRRQHRNLRASFRSVRVNGPIWANLPPATVYTCWQPCVSTNHSE